MCTKKVGSATAWLLAILFLPIAASSQSSPPSTQLPDKPQPQLDAPQPDTQHTVYGAARGVNSTGDIGSYRPITGRGRVNWALKSTFGASNLVFTTFVAGVETGRNVPRSYGTHWDGFGKRFGQKIASAAVDNTLEAGIGAFTGEDPRYFRRPDTTFGQRVKHVVVMTFADRRRDGSLGPAYARFIAYPSSNFLSDSWRVHEDNGNGNAVGRAALDFVGKMAGNAFKEFWPDVTASLFHRK
jgi:hypothetical protein